MIRSTGRPGLAVDECLDALLEARRRRADASRRVERDKAERAQRGLVARLVDLVITTDPERELQRADEHLVATTQETRDRVRLAIDAYIEDLISRDPELLEQVRLARVAVDERSSGLQRAENALRVGVQAQKALDDARVDLDSAIANETLDLATSSKLLAAVSTASNCTAQDSVRSAARALDALRALGQGRTSITAAIDDGLDLALDMVLDLGIDFGSMFSLSSLSQARADCDRAARAIAPVIALLRGTYDGALTSKRTADQALSELLADAQAKAHAELPAVLADLG